jgi:hypothetical protein
MSRDTKRLAAEIAALRGLIAQQEQRINSIAEQRQAAENAQKQGPSRDQVDIIAENKVPPAHTAGDQGKNTERSWLGRATVGIALLTLFVLVGSGVVAYVAWKGSIESARIDQRAWLSVSVKPFDLIDGRQITVPVQIDNTGKTPAIAFDGYFKVTVMPRGHTPPLEYGIRSYHYFGGILSPNGSFSAPFITARDIASPNGPPIVLAPALHDALNRGEAFVIIFAQVTYRDVFHIRHWTRYCGASPVFTRNDAPECADYNGTDDNYEGPSLW